MSLAEAISAVEALFTVHREAGYAEPYRDQNGDPIGDRQHVDMDYAPCGQPYIEVTSHGFGEDQDEPDSNTVTEV